LKRAEKQNVVEALNEKFSKAAAVVLTDYRGLDTAAMNELRVQLREASVEYQVVKNTLMFRASEGTDMALLKDHFVGPSAVAVSYEDPVAPAQVLTKFGKDHPALELKAAVLGGKFVDVRASRPFPNCRPGRSCYPSCCLFSTDLPGPLYRSSAVCPGRL